jgi:hypothetical protein
VKGILPEDPVSLCWRVGLGPSLGLADSLRGGLSFIVAVVNSKANKGSTQGLIFCCIQIDGSLPPFQSRRSPVTRSY